MAGKAHPDRLKRIAIRWGPWAVSFLLHGGLVMAAIFVTVDIKKTAVARSVIIPEAIISDNPGAPMMRQGESAARQEFSGSGLEAQRNTQAMDSAIKLPGNGREMNLISSVSQGGWEASFARTTSSSTDLPGELRGAAGTGLSGGGRGVMGRGSASSSELRSEFYGTGGNAHHIVYVIDASGSMVPEFGDVARQMLLSVGKLRPTQDFHVILFYGDRVVEYTAGKLVPATRDNQLKVSRFMATVKSPQSDLAGTDPSLAMQRAFDVLAKADPKKPGKLIYLLTDAFQFANSDKLLTLIRQRSGAGDVHINTYLYDDGSGDGNAKLLKQIAADTGGVYKFVSPEEY